MNPRTNGRRPPLRAVRLLLPVWGYRYVRQFLEFSLPTMLAAGNLPALVRTLPCTFVLLTSRDDAEFIADHPGYRLLSSICRTEIQPIDDLITGDNYSTTITLAYERAVRATGADLLNTCFFFLISDYLVADGSFRNVLSRIMAGASGVFAGNFQIVQEDAEPEFHRMFEGDGPELTIAPRALMRWSLRHLHPMTAANTVNFPLSHTAHTNRLFWRVDRDTLIGRFYLMHMICIRPEIADFVVGASCDYSFMPEMCPSGAIEVLTDSDEYLVVEMQPRGHERAFLRIGAFDPDDLAETLSEWTTARHRENVRSTLVFRAEGLPDTLAAAISEADRFVAAVGAKLDKAPQPHRDHPYWLGAIAAHRWSLQRIAESRGAGAGAATPVRRPPWTLSRLIQDLRIRVFGRPPYVRPWHPRWPDFRVLLERLAPLVTHSPGPLLTVGHNTVYLKGWVSGLARDVKGLQTTELLVIGRRQYMPLVKQFRGAFVLLGESELPSFGRLVHRILPLVADDGFVMIAVINSRADELHDRFASDFAYWSAPALDAQGAIASAEFVPITWPRAVALRSLMRFDKLLARYPLLAPLLAIPVGLTALATYVANLLATGTHTHTQRSAGYSGVFTVFRPGGSPRLPRFKTEEAGYWSGRHEQPRADGHRVSVCRMVPEPHSGTSDRGRRAARPPLRIGIDFDNTLISYDEVFVAAARERKLLDPEFAGNKQAVRDAIRLLPDGELAWQRLQGHVYGRGIGKAVMFADVDAFLRGCRTAGHQVFIVSHKTEFGHHDPDRVNLRTAALGWMEAHGFFAPDGYGIPRQNVFFEGTRSDKLRRIAALACDCFIDDLEEVLTDPDFPPGVDRILLGDGGPSPRVATRRSWRQIGEALLRGGAAADDAGALAARLLGAPVDGVEQVTRGRNSRVFRISAGGRDYALKRYPAPGADARDRLGTEVEALRLMQQLGVGDVPRVVAADPARHCALLSWLDGTPVAAATDADIDAATRFLAALHAMRRAPAGCAYDRPASEACLSGREAETQIRRRLGALRTLDGEGDLARFLDGTFAPALEALTARAARAMAAAGLDFATPLPQEQQTLAPADFGFHNALRRRDGTLVFVDFEYFGWDDPVKLVADVLHHPGLRLPPPQRARFRAATVAIYGNDDPGFAARLAALDPLFGLRWVLILLNEFLPERWRARVAAGETEPWPHAKARQLARAKEMFAGVASIESVTHG